MTDLTRRLMLATMIASAVLVPFAGAAKAADAPAWTVDPAKSSIAFTGLAGIAALGLTVIWLFMPETRRIEREA